MLCHSLFMPSYLLSSVFVDHAYICVYGHAQGLLFMYTTLVYMYKLRMYSYPKNTSILLDISVFLQMQFHEKCSTSTASDWNKTKAPLVLTHLTNGIVQWVSCGLIPEDGSFALVWDPNPFQSLQLPFLLQLTCHIIQTINHALQQLMWILLIVAVGGRIYSSQSSDRQTVTNWSIANIDRSIKVDLLWFGPQWF